MNSIEKPESSSASVAVAKTTAVAEVEAKVFMARQYPRDIDKCLESILRECKSKRLAEVAQYEFQRGTTVVKGASIRLVEVVARHFGNIRSGVRELERRGNEATVQAYAWDLESNYEDEKTFDIALIRNTRNGSYKLTDERDKYEMIASNGARRKRACIMAVIPGYILDLAVEACEKTLSESIEAENKGKDPDAIRMQYLSNFQALAEWITEDMLGCVIGKEYSKANGKDMVKLRNLYNAIKDGFVKVEAAFGRADDTFLTPSVEEEDQTAALSEALATRSDDTP